MHRSTGDLTGFCKRGFDFRPCIGKDLMGFLGMLNVIILSHLDMGDDRSLHLIDPWFGVLGEFFLLLFETVVGRCSCR